MKLSLWFASLSLVVGCGGVVESTPDGDVEADAAAVVEVDAPAPVANVAGKHVHRLTVDGTSRDVIVYVPPQAAGPTPVPAVFMFHGTSGDGEKFFNISHWREKSDETGLISVYPSALTYCFYEDENRDGDFDDAGERKLTTKWAAGELGGPMMPLCTAQDVAMLSPENQALVDHPLMDDLAFVDAMLDLLSREYAVDASRIYASGFSNGGQMTSRLALERYDRFAAIAAAAGGLAMAPAPIPRPMSFVWSVGTLDDRFTAAAGVSEIPITPTTPGDNAFLHDRVIATYLAMFQLADAYTYDVQTVEDKRIASYRYETSTVGASNSFTFALVEDAEHFYPNGTNHPLVIVNPLWIFFGTQTLP
jgi:polyhydroxybutyrate depolymerase